MLVVWFTHIEQILVLTIEEHMHRLPALSIDCYTRSAHNLLDGWIDELALSVVSTIANLQCLVTNVWLGTEEWIVHSLKSHVVFISLQFERMWSPSTTPTATCAHINFLTENILTIGSYIFEVNWAFPIHVPVAGIITTITWTAIITSNKNTSVRRSHVGLVCHDVNDREHIALVLLDVRTSDNITMKETFLICNSTENSCICEREHCIF